MRFYEASADIDATPDQIWQVLVDGQNWPSWDSGVNEVRGTVGPDEKITIRSKAAPGRAFPVTVTGFEPPRELVFSGGMPLGLFRGVRRYRLTPCARSTQVRCSA